mmetsp:Transcript_22170/g.30943  ORF Transcript_22170/g.30943 Transcript_22170/m.30943 type:complete len:580 (+) Transcript_22170:110-1849(+)|eukprot:CAMPEP_0184487976 /NCGR_PEP_ID=MMETSP0113_2-20130426/10450_1 /TAXON_ID=91329 /ORGANISM="Norrisiella sphaerica, Strain BC52" /LENGTH=579 /DNA_ID=CAMNT_0026870425 /DNA_START=87 /DNA_END=1826 /DNA_ORIENTATION=+
MAESKKPDVWSEEGVKIGILGGGQLARMMSEAAHRVGIKIVALDPQGQKSPAGQIGMPTITGHMNDRKSVMELSKHAKILTFDVEHISADAAEELEKQGWTVEPKPATLKMIQDKLLQKRFFRDVGIATPEFMQIESLDDMKKAAEKFGYPFMMKVRKGGFDGRGNAAVKNAKDLEQTWAELSKNGPNTLMAEKWCPFVKELAVMVARGANSQIDAYPVVETIQSNNICHLVLAPAQISNNAMMKVHTMALECVSNLKGRGIYGVELFVTEDDTVLLNEIAPRPHNSGHYTMEACVTDQFEQHLRAVAGLPLGSCSMRCNAALMLNILGDETETLKGTFEPLRNALKTPDAGIHFYGKYGIRKGRKLAHTTVLGTSISEVLAKADNIIPGASAKFRPGEKKSEKKSPLVGIIMGSDSDLPTMKAAADVLERFQVPYELTIVSAHRTPRRLFSYATTAVDRGIQCIIAGAGGAAHLPGMVAAMTPLPVIGVPVKTSTLSGNDSLLSIVQMPRGVPVATVAIGNSMNAGLLAVRTLGVRDRSLLFKMHAFMREQEESVGDKIDKMDEVGWPAYLKQMPPKK